MHVRSVGNFAAFPRFNGAQSPADKQTIVNAKVEDGELDQQEYEEFIASMDKLSRMGSRDSVDSKRSLVMPGSKSKPELRPADKEKVAETKAALSALDRYLIKQSVGPQPSPLSKSWTPDEFLKSD